MKYDIKVGDIFIAADGGKYGHLVTDVTTYAHCDDVVTIPFVEAGMEFNRSGNRIDAFKLAKVRYYKPDAIPDWVPGMPNIDPEFYKKRKENICQNL